MLRVTNPTITLSVGVTVRVVRNGDIHVVTDGEKNWYGINNDTHRKLVH